MGAAPFESFIGGFLNLYERLTRELAANNRQFVMAAGKHALAVLRNYRPDGDGEEMLLESTVEVFEDLVRKAGGTP